MKSHSKVVIQFEKKSWLQKMLNVGNSCFGTWKKTKEEIKIDNLKNKRKPCPNLILGLRVEFDK